MLPVATRYTIREHTLAILTAIHLVGIDCPSDFQNKHLYKAKPLVRFATKRRECYAQINGLAEMGLGIPHIAEIFSNIID